MAQDEAARLQWCEAQVAYLQERLKSCAHFEAERCWPNQAGQPLPRAFVTLKNTNATPSQLRALLMRDNPGIFCYSENRQGVYINPMCLNEGDMAIIADRFAALDQEV
jgi:L-seryl-tRNA(Ser) seleniumtransferase